MKKQFIFNILLLIFLNALIKPFWVFGIDRTFQNTVGAGAYGLYFALFNFSILFNTFLDIGITNFNNRSIAQNPGNITHQFPRLIMIKMLLGIIYMLLCIGTSIYLKYSSVEIKILGLLAINQFLSSMLLFFRSNISGLQLFKIDSILSVCDRFLMIIFSSVILWTSFLSLKPDIVVFIEIQTLAYLLACFLAFVFLMKRTGKIFFRDIPLFSWELLSKSLPFALLGLLMSAYTRIDAVMLERLLPDGAKAAGIYAQSFRVFDAVTMISVLFASLLFPMFARLRATKTDIKPLLKLSFSILFTGIVLLAINLVVYAKPLLSIMYRELYPSSYKVFILLIICIVPVSLTYIFGTLLTADGKLKTLNIISAVALLINVTLNFILIPLINVTGAAISAIISQFIVALLQIFICKKEYKLHISINQFLVYGTLFLCSLVVAMLIYNLNMAILLKIVISLLFSFVLALALKIINIKEILLAFKSDIQ